VNTNGWIRDEGYDLLLHTAAALKISVLLIVGHDRLYSMMTNHYKKLQKEDTSNSPVPKVLKLPRSGGVVSRPTNFIRQCRSRAVKRYFYGDLIQDPNSTEGKDDNSTRVHQLTPFLVQLPFGEIKVYRVSSMALSSSLLPVAQAQSTDAIQIQQLDLEGDSEIAESLQHSLVAVCHPSAVALYEQTGRGRDLVTAGVAGFCSVERIVKETDQIHLLSPCAGSLPSKTLIVGDITWVE
jgi:polyribonucleotide 5'-hydroxyl-kinase